jgi:RND family efflux transporter MFP subunit
MAGTFNEKVQPGFVNPEYMTSQDTIVVSRRKQPVYESVPAGIEAKQATIISSRILARIEKVHVRAGDTVTKGDLLVELEKSDLQSKVSQAQSTLESVSVLLKEAKTSLGRVLKLSDKNVLSQSDRDRAQANYDALLANFSTSEQAVNEANAALNFATVTAPINGRIIDRFAEPGDTAQPGIQLLSLYNPVSLRVEAHVREHLAVSLSIDQNLQVTIPALKMTVDSQIEELVPAADSGSRSFLVKSRLQQAQGLLPGMYAQLRIPAGIKDMLVLPAERIASVGQLDTVRVLHAGSVERRFIKAGKRLDDGMVEIISGLVAGDQVLPPVTRLD